MILPLLLVFSAAVTCGVDATMVSGGVAETMVADVETADEDAAAAAAAAAFAASNFCCCIC